MQKDINVKNALNGILKKNKEQVVSTTFCFTNELVYTSGNKFEF